MSADCIPAPRLGAILAAASLALGLSACDKPITDAEYWTIESSRERAGCDATGYCDQAVTCPPGKRQVGPSYSCTPVAESLAEEE